MLSIFTSAAKRLDTHHLANRGNSSNQHVAHTPPKSCFASQRAGNLLLPEAGSQLHCRHLPVKHGSSSGAQTAVFNRWSEGHCLTEERANWSDSFVRPVPAGPVRPVPGTDWTGLSDPLAVPVQPPVEHGCLSTAQTAVFDRLMPAVLLPESSWQAGSQLLPKSSQQAGGQLLPEISWQAGATCFPRPFSKKKAT
ncbi:hypothetical protein PCANC_27221 [Puccinia coronata f. sp. avenae]|uniref:Uncharacterized protein n=1 Tax=Puccinia coronata f. sp. avenae TaxID=200324 RepID=A0A2N5TKV7_9BASI|nr:hypothetical protein PCANC_27221 [Puccinia coronata f. sp. avenae]